MNKQTTWKSIVKQEATMMIIGPFVSAFAQRTIESNSDPMVFVSDSIIAQSRNRDVDVDLNLRYWLEMANKTASIIGKTPAIFTVKKAKNFIFAPQLPLSVVAYEITMAQRGSNNPLPSGDIAISRWQVNTRLLSTGVEIDAIDTPLENRALRLHQADKAATAPSQQYNSSGTFRYLPTLRDYSNKVTDQSARVSEGISSQVIKLGDANVDVLTPDYFFSGVEPSGPLNKNHTVGFSVGTPASITGSMTIEVAHPFIGDGEPVVVAIVIPVGADIGPLVRDALISIPDLTSFFDVFSDPTTVTALPRLIGDPGLQIYIDISNVSGSTLILGGNLFYLAEDFVAALVTGTISPLSNAGYGPRFFSMPDNLEADVSVLPIDPMSDQGAQIYEHVVGRALSVTCTVLPYITS